MAHRDIEVEFEWNGELNLEALARALLEHVRLSPERSAPTMSEAKQERGAA